MGCKIYVGNVPERAGTEDYKDIFGKHGHIVNIEPKVGFGFVEYESRSECDEAISHLNGGDFLGSLIRVELAHTETGAHPKRYLGAGGKPGDGACFKCGGLGHYARECPSRLPAVFDRPGADFTRDSYPPREDRYYPPAPALPADRGYDRAPTYDRAQPASDRYSRDTDFDYRRRADYPPAIPPPPRGYDRNHDRGYEPRDYESSSYRASNYSDRISNGGSYYPPPPRGTDYERDYDRRGVAPPNAGGDRLAHYARSRTGSPPRGYDRSRDVHQAAVYRGRSPPPRDYPPVNARPASPGRSYRPRRSLSPRSRAAPPPYAGRRSPSPGRRGGPRTPSPTRR